MRVFVTGGTGHSGQTSSLSWSLPGTLSPVSLGPMRPRGHSPHSARRYAEATRS